MTTSSHPLLVFLGKDSREPTALGVARYSLLRRTKGVHITNLDHRELRKEGLFERPWRIDESGQFWDDRDGKPFSTEFSFTRFLVPEICRRAAYKGFAVFADCDFLFLNNIYALIEAVDPSKAVSVVKFKWQGREGTKMDGMAQTKHPRKLWSSLMVFNMKHKANENLTAETVNNADGTDLQNFHVYKSEDIGDLPFTWNYVPGVSADTPIPGINAIHYSEYAPWFTGQEYCALSELWWREYDSYRRSIGQLELPTRAIIA